MRRLITLFILLAAFVQQSMAQEAFYVYRNDGHFNAFRFEQVDSMKYGKVLDGVEYENFVVQEVYTSDSLYQIPLNVIDSIGFSTPFTVYAGDVRHLTSETLEYLIMADAETMKLTLVANTPARLIPEIGEKIAALELTDKNPFGFVGRVTSVFNTAESIIVNCSELDLEEVVDRFYGTARITTQESTETYAPKYTQRKASRNVEQRPFSLNIKKYFPKTIDFSDLPLYSKEDVNGVSAGASLTVDMERPLVGGFVTRVVDKNRLLSYTNLFLTATGKTVTDVQLTGSIGAGIRPALDIPIPIYGVKMIGLSLGARLEANAGVSLMYTEKSDFDWSMDVTYYPYLPLVFNLNPTIISHSTDKKTIPTQEWKSISLDGEISFTPFIDFGILFGDHKIGWAGVEVEGGIKADANISFTSEHLKEASLNTAFYDFFRDRKVGIEGYVRAGLTLQLSKASWWEDYDFKPSAKLTWPIGERKEWYFLPQFNETRAYRPLPNWNAIEATPTPYSEHLWPYTIGIVLRNIDGQEVDLKYYGDDKKYRTQTDSPQEPLFFSKDINREEHYKVNPTFKLLGFDVMASPASEIGTTIPVSITTVTTTAAQYRPTDHPQHFTYQDKPYEFKYDVATTVKLTDDEGVENWGYVYEGPYEGDKKSRISLKGATSEYEDTRFAYYRNGNPTKHTARLYPFVKYTGDDEYYYGEPVDYPLIYPETSTVELTGCSTGDVVTRENVEYNGVTYDYCSTFILDYNATGAYWLTVGAEETGNGWSAWESSLPAREQARAADGSNRLTINYYYNQKVLEGDYLLRIKGNDEQHGTSCTSSKSVRLTHNGKTFTGCELIQ